MRARRVRVVRENGRANVLKQNGVELGDGLGDAVILLHQLFAGQERWRVDKAHFLGDGPLMIEQQAILATSDVDM